MEHPEQWSTKKGPETAFFRIILYLFGVLPPTTTFAILANNP
jgi:hypothetical protein